MKYNEYIKLNSDNGTCVSCGKEINKIEYDSYLNTFEIKFLFDRVKWLCFDIEYGKLINAKNIFEKTIKITMHDKCFKKQKEKIIKKYMNIFNSFKFVEKKCNCKKQKWHRLQIIFLNNVFSKHFIDFDCCKMCEKEVIILLNKID